MIDAVGNPQSILLLGGTSEIGLATVEAFASDRPRWAPLLNAPTILRISSGERPGSSSTISGCEGSSRSGAARLA